jgi:hypothetical protein
MSASLLLAGCHPSPQRNNLGFVTRFGKRRPYWLRDIAWRQMGFSVVRVSACPSCARCEEQTHPGCDRPRQESREHTVSSFAASLSPRLLSEAELDVAAIYVNS